MNLIQHREPNSKEFVYFWIREADNVILSPIWTNREDAETWMQAICIDLGILKPEDVVENDRNESDKESSE